VRDQVFCEKACDRLKISEACSLLSAPAALITFELWNRKVLIGRSDWQNGSASEA